MLMNILFVLFIFLISNSYSYNTNPTSYLCTDSLTEIPQKLPSCLPGYIIDIENVFYESTVDNSCSGTTLCRVENKNSLQFACNRKRRCNVNIDNLRFHINSTCGTTVRFYTKYRCLPVIQEQNDHLCEPLSSSRRLALGDIKLECQRNYRLHITSALIGISIKKQDELTKNHFKCNKDTQTVCNSYVPNAYRDVCDNPLRPTYDDHCTIKYNERPALKDCPYGMTSNFSLVEYLCIPGYGITEDLPRFDICSNEIPQRIPNDRGLLYSPNYPQDVAQYLSCNKQLYVPRQSRLRLFMLEKSIEYSHVLNINLLNNIRTLAVNELLDINITQRNDEIAQFELKTNHLGGGKFLLYFQIDSRLSEYAPFDLDPDRRLDSNSKHGKTSLKRQWGIVTGCIIGLLLLLLLLATIFIIFRITKRRRERSLKYLKSDDDHRERLSVSKPSSSNNHHHHQVEQPYLASSSPAILPLTSSSNHNRPHSASSTTSSTIVHQINDGQSDRESLIKPTGQIQSHSNADIDNFYEEIKEQQQQTALALGLNTSKGDILNPYLEAKCFEQRKPLFQGNTHPSIQPIRDHHENDSHYQHPISSTDRIISNEPVKPKKRPPPKIPTQRMDIQHPEPSAPPLHIIEDNNNEN
ncbi:unnamed protein product [Adineta steineri]|uniref:Uncharacterized protein n=1 Tax=Adineta steineri TaxID=433720 RepID=A0A814ZR61_9BILA|nr:unnamed protein product [Adineta steineri]